MKIVCAPQGYEFQDDDNLLNVVLYANADRQSRGSAGRMIKDEINRQKLLPAARAWDFLSIALAVAAADRAGFRGRSPDGWTRRFELTISVVDQIFWMTQKQAIEQALRILSTDSWNITFVEGGFQPSPPQSPDLPIEECIALLSGGLDSFIGNIDLAAAGKRAIAVSHTVRGDGEKQGEFAAAIGGLRHLQLSHNAKVPEEETPPSQRARSLSFLAYGVLAATTLKRYHAGEAVVLYVCENGFISINPPLTDMRLGSLSTRTTHPVFLGLIQGVLDAAGLRVAIENPYQLRTKGEMIKECKDQGLLAAHVCRTTSCGRFGRFGYKHCGRCIPCLVRRAAFHSADFEDTTKYNFEKLGRDDKDHAGFDDVRAVAMGLVAIEEEGFERWLGPSLSTALLGDTSALEATVHRGMGELGALLNAYGVA
jgi:7-cyano-7-deazaguanine synthase in queuosine biosynthesis